MPSIHRLVCSTWCSLLLLSTLSACAGPDGARLPHTDMPRADLPQQATVPASTIQHSVAQVPPEPPTLTPAAANPPLIALADPSLAATPAKREQLTYLVRCALPAEVTVYTEHNGTRFTFPGGMGLAPRWVDEAMTPAEERWVSACLLAHANYFGISVLVSMRASPPPVPTLVASDDESRHFSIFEGGFFGNLFTPEPVAYACRGARTPSQAGDPILQQRLCTHETGETTPAGLPLTACRFVLTGPCEDPASLTVQGSPYREVIFTYLRPGTPERAPGALTTAGSPGGEPSYMLP